MDSLPKKTKANLLKTEVYALYLATKDSRTPFAAKAVAVLTVAYALSPIDLIPDFIPFIGLLDDVIIVPLGLWLAIKLTPKEVMDEARNKAQVELKPLKKVFWVAGAVAVLFWLVMLLFAILLITRLIRHFKS